MSETANRREGFRMDDVLKLRVSIPDIADADGILTDFEDYRLRTCLQSHLRNQTENRLPKLQGIRKRDPEIASYLEHLETQIIQLAAQISRDSGQSFNETHPETRVNLSANGLRFPTTETFEAGQQLELDIMLSSGAHMVVLAEVLRVEALPTREEGGTSAVAGQRLNQVSTCFSKIHADDIEVIIRHLARLQQRLLQARREES